MRYMISIEYDGTRYKGWQKQKDNIITIQGCIEEALYSLTGTNVQVFGAGRTDTGVHALNQVAHFDLQKPYPPYKVANALNFYLTKQHPYLKQDIVIKECRVVEEDFDARFSAKTRQYKYLIYNKEYPSALLQERAWWIRKTLDQEAMENACQYLIGKMDFSAFRCSECQAKNPVKTILDCHFSSSRDNILVFRIKAKSFMQHMVRNIIGTLKDVGTHKISIQNFQDIILSKDRSKAGVTAPPYGLYLEEILY